MPEIRALALDADGVVQHWSVDELWARLEAILGFVPATRDQFVREVYEAERLALVGQADFALMLEPVVARWGAAGKAARLAADWGCSIEVDAPLLELIGQVRARGICCALATNQQSYRARYMRETLGYGRSFDRAFYSCEVGSRKPDLPYFEALVAGLGLAPQEILFIDDTEGNVAGARRAGLQAEHFVHARGTSGAQKLAQLLQRFGVLEGTSFA
ncbi:MAG: HAD-IA family hydrolase [Deltaproteobacteria bacterium]